MSNDEYKDSILPEEKIESIDYECKYCKSMLKDKEILGSEDLVIWYLRLNGFFTIKNFVVHPEKGPNQKTDIDALAIRLPHRAEGLTKEDEMIDDSTILSISDDVLRPLILIAEVKKDICKLNDTWKNRENKNMERFLKAIGCTPTEKIEKVADALYSVGIYREDYTISLICFGKMQDIELKNKKPEITQIVWSDVLGFIYDRFKNYSKRKSSHGQWDDTGHKLWDLCRIFNSRDCFIDNATKLIR